MSLAKPYFWARDEDAHDKTRYVIFLILKRHLQQNLDLSIKMAQLKHRMDMQMAQEDEAMHA